MTPEQRRRVRELFEAALDRAGEAAWIANQAADDPVVRDEVLSLVEHHSKAGDFLARPIIDDVPDLLADEEGLAPGARPSSSASRSGTSSTIGRARKSPAFE